MSLTVIRLWVDWVLSEKKDGTVQCPAYSDSSANSTPDGAPSDRQRSLQPDASVQVRHTLSNPLIPFHFCFT